MQHVPLENKYTDLKGITEAHVSASSTLGTFMSKNFLIKLIEITLKDHKLLYNGNFLPHILVLLLFYRLLCILFKRHDKIIKCFLMKSFMLTKDVFI